MSLADVGRGLLASGAVLLACAAPSLAELMAGVVPWWLCAAPLLCFAVWGMRWLHAAEKEAR